MRNKPLFRTMLAATAILSCTALAAAQSSLGGPLTLVDEGSFFVGGRNHISETADARGTTAVKGEVRTGQLYVQFRIPDKANAIPVVMVHGANHTGVTYETTPDGREGWATYFARRNFPVYVVDQAGRGRSGFDPSAINRAKLEWSTKDLPAIAIATRENAWMSYRLGPVFGTFWPDSRFPQKSLDQYFSQSAAMAETTLPGALAPGWHPQPDGRERFWDGSRWTDHFRQPAQVSAEPVPRGIPGPGSSDGGFYKAWMGYVGVSLIAFLLGVGIGASGNGAGDARPSAGTDARTSTVTATVTTGPTPTATVTVTTKVTAPPLPPKAAITEGIWTVGVDIKAGTYKVIEPVSDDCYWGITRTGTNGRDIIANDIVTGGRPEVTLKKGQDFDNRGCGDWALVK